MILYNLTNMILFIILLLIHITITVVISMSDDHGDCAHFYFFVVGSIFLMLFLVMSYVKSRSSPVFDVTPSVMYASYEGKGFVLYEEDAMGILIPIYTDASPAEVETAQKHTTTYDNSPRWWRFTFAKSPITEYVYPLDIKIIPKVAVELNVEVE